ncbi:hypothetical protein CZ774_10240 [Frigoribacterium sp. JB110]|nr:hypothetical protein CZ774_10240 [Frigoribacterium sp. JB110]
MRRALSADRPGCASPRSSADIVTACLSQRTLDRAPMPGQRVLVRR